LTRHHSRSKAARLSLLLPATLSTNVNKNLT
jgi:hypothetical protein